VKKKNIRRGSCVGSHSCWRPIVWSLCVARQTQRPLAFFARNYNKAWQRSRFKSDNVFLSFLKRQHTTTPNKTGITQLPQCHVFCMLLAGDHLNNVGSAPNTGPSSVFTPNYSKVWQRSRLKFDSIVLVFFENSRNGHTTTRPNKNKLT